MVVPADPCKPELRKKLEIGWIDILEYISFWDSVQWVFSEHRKIKNVEKLVVTW